MDRYIIASMYILYNIYILMYNIKCTPYDVMNIGVNTCTSNGLVAKALMMPRTLQRTIQRHLRAMQKKTVALLPGRLLHPPADACRKLIQFKTENLNKERHACKRSPRKP